MKKLLKDNGLKYKDLEKVEELIAVRKLGSTSSNERRRDYIQPKATPSGEKSTRPSKEKYEEEPTKLSEEEPRSKQAEDDNRVTKPSDQRFGTPEDQRFGSGVSKHLSGQEDQQDSITPENLLTDDQRYGKNLSGVNQEDHQDSAPEDQKQKTVTLRDVTNQEKTHSSGIPFSQRDALDGQQDEVAKLSGKRSLESRSISKERATTEYSSSRNEELKSALPKSTDGKTLASKTISREHQESQSSSVKRTDAAKASKDQEHAATEYSASKDEEPKNAMPKLTDEKTIASKTISQEDQESQSSSVKRTDTAKASKNQKEAAADSKTNEQKTLEFRERAAEPAVSKDEDPIKETPILSSQEPASETAKLQNQARIDGTPASQDYTTETAKSSDQKSVKPRKSLQANEQELNTREAQQSTGTKATTSAADKTKEKEPFAVDKTKEKESVEEVLQPVTAELTTSALAREKFDHLFLTDTIKEKEPEGVVKPRQMGLSTAAARTEPDAFILSDKTEENELFPSKAAAEFPTSGTSRKESDLLEPLVSGEALSSSVVPEDVFLRGATEEQLPSSSREYGAISSHRKASLEESVSETELADVI